MLMLAEYPCRIKVCIYIYKYMCMYIYKYIYYIYNIYIYIYIIGANIYYWCKECFSVDGHSAVSDSNLYLASEIVSGLIQTLLF